MPSFPTWLRLNFSKKKAGNKFHDYHHGYDNLRHSSYPATPPTLMSQQHPYTQAPPHSYSHKHHLYQQQLILQSPPLNQLNQTQHQFQQQAVTPANNTNNGNSLTNNPIIQQQCQCNQCSFQQSQVQTPGINQFFQSPTVQARAQMPLIDTHLPMTGLPPQQHHQQQQQQVTHQPALVPQNQSKFQTDSNQQCQHTNQLQHTAYQCHNSAGFNNGNANQSFPGSINMASQLPDSPPQAPIQCTCQYCPYQHQQQQQPTLSSSQTNPQLMNHSQTGATCQHLMTGAVVHNGSNLGANQQIGQSPHNYAPQQQNFPPHAPQHIVPTTLNSSTPISQAQQPSHQNSINPNHQLQYHTIQPNQYQAQKEQMQYQQALQQHHHHHRVQSLHQQQSQHVQQPLNGGSQLHQSLNQLGRQDKMHQHEVDTTQSQPQELKPKGHDFSQYANMQACITLMDGTRGRTDYNDHVYYNQQQELPPYKHPPDYNSFVQQRKMFMIEPNGQSVAQPDELRVFREAKDSSYENLKLKSSLYSNLCTSRQEPGYTS